jgi:hypothetical protein
VSRSRATLAALCAALSLAALPVVGCGDDDDETTSSVTTTTEEPAPQDETTTTTESGDDSGGGSGGTAPGGGGGYGQDREGNDVPPPEGSPAEEAEQTCLENPGAC